MNNITKLHEHVRDQLAEAYKALKTWPQVSQAIARQIELKQYKKLKNYADPKSWQRLSETGGDTLGTDYWKELQNALSGILEEGNQQDFTEEKINDNIKSTIRFAITPCHDTVIPAVYIHRYEERFQNKFELYPCRDWEINITEVGNEYDFIVHNFSTVLSYNAFNSQQKTKSEKLLYWPLFDFKGYYLFIKISSLEKNTQKTHFKYLSPAERKKLLESCKFIVEEFTDFEWVLKKYCSRYNCDISIIQNNIINCNTNVGKSDFINSNDADIYVTNSVHGYELEKNENLELIAKTDNITDHLNSNGLICSEKYYANNSQITHSMINRWFMDIISFKNDLNKAQIAGEHIHLPIMGLTRFLENKLNARMKEEDLNRIYAYDIFYDNLKQIFMPFYETILSQDKKVNNYIEIARTQLRARGFDDEISDYDFKNEINILKERMINIYHGQ